MVARTGQYPPFPPPPPRPGSNREVFGEYKTRLSDALARASAAETDLDLEDALASLDFFLDKMHERFKNK